MQRYTKGSQQPAKPYFWVQLRGRPHRQSPAGHERFIGYSGRLDLQLEVVSDYLFVGSGGIAVQSPNGRGLRAYYTFARRNERLIVPATSIKGAVRSIVEAISNSCVPLRGRKERVPDNHQPCRDPGKLCPACRIFGTTGWRGHAYFSDAEPVGDLKPEIVKIADLWQPRAAQGRKFYHVGRFQTLDSRPEKNHRFIEAVPRGSRFSTVLSFENMSAAEMCLILAALGLSLSDGGQVASSFPIKLGGAKPRCLGAVSVTPQRLVLVREGSDLIKDLIQGGARQQLQEWLRTWLRACDLLDRSSWEEFRRQCQQNAAPRADRSCPEGVY